MKNSYLFSIRKIILISLANFMGLLCFAQSGIYKTVEDYKNGKPSITGDRINYEFSGNHWTFTLFNGKDKQKFDSKSIWGVKIGDGDYRIIDGKPHFIATKGAIYVYSGDACWLETQGDLTIFHKIGNSYTLAAKGPDGTPEVMHSYKDVLKLMDPAKAAEIKELVGKKPKDPKDPYVLLEVMTSQRNPAYNPADPSSSKYATTPTRPGQKPINYADLKSAVKALLTSMTEDVADYYNSTQPGYLTKRYNVFVYDYHNQGMF